MTPSPTSDASTPKAPRSGRPEEPRSSIDLGKVAAVAGVASLLATLALASVGANTAVGGFPFLPPRAGEQGAALAVVLSAMLFGFGSASRPALRAMGERAGLLAAVAGFAGLAVPVGVAAIAAMAAPGRALLLPFYPVALYLLVWGSLGLGSLWIATCAEKSAAWRGSTRSGRGEKAR